MDRLSKIKRIIALFCCTLLLSMSIFMSYSTAVYADDDYDFLNATDDFLNVCLVIGGIIFSAPSGGLSYLATIKGIIGLRDSVENLIDYITDNGDDTYTIDEGFIQAVMDAAQELEDQGFTDKNVERQGDYLYNYKLSVVSSYMYNINNKQESHTNTYMLSKELTQRVAGIKETKSSITSNGRSVVNISFNASTSSGTISAYGKVTESIDGTITYDRYRNKTVLFSVTNYDGTQNYDTYSGTLSVGGNFPIFTDYEALENYLETGKGYKDAINYRPTPLFRYHSSYTPTYSGGSVTVSRTVINNINQKITEVDSDVSLTDDQKIEILQQYIYSGGTSGTGGGGSGSYPGDTDYDDNKDLPPGTDLTDTNSWLKKIYLKVCQIYDKMNSAVEAAGDAALARIQESLDEIIEQLKKIKRWTAVDTVIDGVDAVADWLDLIRDVLEDGAGSAVAALSSALQDSTDMMKQKFPFSIPWDILFLVTVLSAEPETPQFSIPFNFEFPALDLSVDYEMELDFTQFQWLSDLSRLLLSLTYAAGLMKKTVDIVSANKEG